MTRPADLIQKARDAGLTIAVAESCTGGLLAAALTETAGSSDVFDRGVVTYSNAAKIALLGVNPDSIAAEGAVSEAVAAQMAEGMLARSDADLTASITGIAGPGGSEHKPEGRVCFGLATRGGATRTETVEFGARGRAEVRAASVDHALALLAGAISP